MDGFYSDTTSLLFSLWMFVSLFALLSKSISKRVRNLALITSILMIVSALGLEVYGSLQQGELGIFLREFLRYFMLSSAVFYIFLAAKAMIKDEPIGQIR